MAPRPLGSASVIVSLSLAMTAHPAGTGTVTPLFEAVGPWAAIGEATGLGDPAGVGLGTSVVMPPLELALVPKKRDRRAASGHQHDQRNDCAGDEDPRGAVDRGLGRPASGRVVRACICHRAWRR